MPYARDGATKVSDHWVRSPLLNINRACQTCHKFSEKEIEARVARIQDTNYRMLQDGGKAIVALIDEVIAARRTSNLPRRWSFSERRSGGSISSPPRTRWDFMRRRKPPAFSARRRTSRGRDRLRRFRLPAESK